MPHKCTRKLQDAVFKLDRAIKPSENRAQSSNAFALSYILKYSDFVEMFREIRNSGVNSNNCIVQQSTHKPPKITK